jgi:hypothetical protein
VVKALEDLQADIFHQSLNEEISGRIQIEPE